MAKKLGKILLAAAALGSAAAATYYFMRKKDSAMTDADFSDDDYDDFSTEDLDDDSDTSRNYVSLTPAPAETENTEETTEPETPVSDAEAGSVPESDFTPLSQTLSESTAEEVEEFFNEDQENKEV